MEDIRDLFLEKRRRSVSVRAVILEMVSNRLYALGRNKSQNRNYFLALGGRPPPFQSSMTPIDHAHFPERGPLGRSPVVEVPGRG